MTKQELIDKCRYFKGDHVKIPKGKETFANIERLWVRLSLDEYDDMIPSCYAEYVRLGLTHFSENDGVDVNLKAFLCNRFFHHTERIDVDAFKKFYADYKNSQ